MAEGNVVLCGCPNCQRAVTPTPQGGAARWYVCTRCGLFYQSHHGCGCALAAAEARERALREALRELHATMIDLIEWQAVEHEDPTCPQDDTCECPRVQRIDAACHAASAALSEEGSHRG